MIFIAAGFSFLGLGIQDPTADWGKMINDSRVVPPDRPPPGAGPDNLHRRRVPLVQLRRGRATGRPRPHFEVGASWTMGRSERSANCSHGVSPPLLEVRDLHVSFQMEFNTIYAVQGLSLEVQGRREARSRWRKRVGQEHNCALDHADGAVTRPDHRRRDHLRRPRAGGPVPQRDAPGQRPPDRHDPAKPVDIAQPRADRRGPLPGGAVACTSGSTRTSPATRTVELLTLGRYPRPSYTDARVPSPPERRAAPTGHNRPGHGMSSHRSSSPTNPRPPST